MARQETQREKRQLFRLLLSTGYTKDYSRNSTELGKKIMYWR